MRKLSELAGSVRRKPGRALLAGTVILVIAVAAIWASRGGSAAGGSITFKVKRGTLDIAVLEGGSIESLESQEARSEFKGYQGTKIIKIVEEGYQVTDEDVKSGKVLVELDSSELRQRLTTQDIQFQSTLASLTEAQQAYEIQVNQNKTDIKAAEQKAKFARMDLEKFMGTKATEEIVDLLGLRERPFTNFLQEAASAAAPGNPPASAEPTIGSSPGKAGGGGDQAEPNPPAVPKAPEAPPPAALQTEPPPVVIDYTKYARTEILGDGAAKQQLRKLEDDLLVSKNELGMAQAKLDGTKRLHEKGFVTKSELENEQLGVDKTVLRVDTAGTARDLFVKYEFTKQAEEFVSKFEEALRGLERARKEALSKLAQARAKLKGAEGRFNIETAQRKDLADQIEKCTIRAKKAGLVVYGGGNQDMMFYGQEQIREGATVRERQPIFTIPDISKMAVRVKIHEAHIKKVQKGMKTRITVDAFPDDKLEGEVTKVGVLPDSQNRWVNPDLKVYVCMVTITDKRDWLRPGMSAKVEIEVRKLPNVVHIPLQAVSVQDGKRYCFLPGGRTQNRREIELGESSDEFVEVKKGLSEGETVLLRPPDGAKEAGARDGDKDKKSTETPVRPAAVPSPPPSR